VVADFVQETLKIDCIPYYAELRIEERAEALARFDAGGVRILISSDLASRGLDFMLPVDAIVEFDMAENIVNFLNRAGRCARNDLSGQSTSSFTQ
jgi:ATP-dependent RNA helicase RhlE